MSSSTRPLAILYDLVIINFKQLAQWIAHEMFEVCHKYKKLI